MNTKAKANSVITHEVVGNTIVFNVLGVGKLEFDTTKTSDACDMRAKIHGYIQRVSDGAAKSRNPETGKPATAREKFDAMKRIVDHLETGTDQWSLVREAGESLGGLLFRALCILSKSKTPDEIREWMKGQSNAQLRVLAMSEKVAKVINEIRPESDIDVDSMLDEIGA